MFIHLKAPVVPVSAGVEGVLELVGVLEESEEDGGIAWYSLLQGIYDPPGGPFRGIAVFDW